MITAISEERSASPDDLGLIRVRDAKEYLATLPNGLPHLHLSALLSEVDRLARKVTLQQELEGAMTDCVEPREGQTFEERAEELAVTEAQHSKLRADFDALSGQFTEARRLLSEHIHGHAEYRNQIRDFLSRTEQP